MLLVVYVLPRNDTPTQVLDFSFLFMYHSGILFALMCDFLTLTNLPQLVKLSSSNRQSLLEVTQTSAQSFYTKLNSSSWSSATSPSRISLGRDYAAVVMLIWAKPQERERGVPAGHRMVWQQPMDSLADQMPAMMPAMLDANNQAYVDQDMFRQYSQHRFVNLPVSVSMMPLIQRYIGQLIDQNCGDGLISDTWASVRNPSLPAHRSSTSRPSAPSSRPSGPPVVHSATSEHQL